MPNGGAFDMYRKRKAMKMGKRNDFMLFPGGKKKAMTFSYDDGVIQDRRLVELFNRYHVKGTFNLNTETLGFQGFADFQGKHVDISKIAPQEVASLYQGHEVGGHSLCHSFLQNVGTAMAMHELIEDRIQLEKLSGRMVRFFAYPFGTYNEEVKQLVRMAGYVGARTVVSTHSFEIPADFMEWHATCHHNDPELMELARKFCQGPAFGASLFYLWGHAYEFDGDGNWSVIEEFLGYVSQFEKEVWFAGNTELADYVTAFRQRVYSADGSRIYNPTAIAIWIQVGTQIHEIPAGATVKVEA